MNERKGNRDSNFANLRVGRRKRAPKPHAAEPASVDFVDDAQPVDGDVTFVLEPRELPGRGERAMLATLLTLAREDAKRGDPDAVRWLLDDAERGAPGTFVVVEVLDHLQLDRAAFLERLHVLLRQVEQRPDAARNDVLITTDRVAA